MTAARDRLHAAQAERRRREDTALAQYAAAAGEADAVIARRDGVLAELDRRRHAVHDQAAAELAALEQRQTGVLAELAALGRRAEYLAALLDVPVKRVRTLLQHHRNPAETDPNPDDTPPPGTSGGAQWPAVLEVPDAITATVSGPDTASWPAGLRVRGSPPQIPPEVSHDQPLAPVPHARRRDGDLV